mmetsp:Transcript_15538/g.35569  ORF Transcript_15538/g.35569 Transcript_15538/m.35569 type:complete len:791 (+) Transcript_15538:43-2415(+)
MDSDVDEEELYAGSPRLGDHSPRVGALPPLASTETASARLLQHLRRIDGNEGLLSTCPTSSSAVLSSTTSLRTNTTRGDDVQGSPLKSISRFGVRANQRAFEAMEVFVVHDSLHEAAAGGATSSNAAGGGGVPKPTDLASVHRAFEHIVAGIDGALCGGPGDCALLRRGEELNDEAVPAHASRHYRIQLPTTPTKIVVVLTRTVGSPPIVYGSTTSERPHARNNDIRSKDGVLTYDHTLLSIDDADEAGSREGVPAARDLWLTVQADASEGCRYKLFVSFKPFKKALARNDMNNQVQKLRRGWEAKLLELQREPQSREDFEDRLKALRASAAMRKLEGRHNGGIPALNIARMREHTPRRKLQQLQSRALRRCAQQDAVNDRRKSLEEQTEKRKAQWLDRAKMRRLKQEEHAHLLQTMVDNEDRQRTWLELIVALSFGFNCREKLQRVQDMNRMLKKKVYAVCAIQAWALRRYAWMRRANLYMNVERFRWALTAYTRAVRPALIQASQPPVRIFIENFYLKQERPQLASILSTFRNRVMKIQRWYHRVRRMREAWHQVLREEWRHSQAKALKDMVVKIVHQREEQRKEEQHHHHHGDGHSQKKSLRRGRTRMMLRKFVQEEQLRDSMPLFLMDVCLKEYIVSMHHTFRARYQQWEAARAQVTFQKDLKAFGVDADNAVIALADTLQPRAVYVDHAELASVAKKKAAAFLDGRYKWIEFHRMMFMRRAFKAFARVWQRAKKVELGMVKGERDALPRENTSSVLGSPTPMSPRSSAALTFGLDGGALGAAIHE